MIVLGIETSCDETGVALYSAERGIIAEALYSQIELHEEFGGVVPELASRDHIRKLLPLTQQVLQQANIDKPDAIAYTQGPGLAGALLVGAATAKSMAMAWDIPALGVHHMEGHLLAPLLPQASDVEQPEFPFVALLVSGGHTQLLKVSAIGQYELLGESIDDAAGEAFDKAAKMMDLPYPGGPSIARLADKGDATAFDFPRPMCDRPGLDFSFSGLKTFFRNLWAKHQADADEKTQCDIAASFQEAIVDTILIKCRRALEQAQCTTLVMAGGVSANARLRGKLEQKLNGINVVYPPLKLCTDNGAMIAYAGALRLYQQQQDADDLKIQVRPRWPIAELETL